jgi:hypothetical protein
MKHQEAPKREITVPLANIESATLRRLVEEVRNDIAYPGPRAFDRIHNRHNRS